MQELEETFHRRSTVFVFVQSPVQQVSAKLTASEAFEICIASSPVCDRSVRMFVLREKERRAQAMYMWSCLSR